MKEVESLKELISSTNLDNKYELLELVKVLEGNLKNKKYGLVWEEKSEDIEEDLKNKFIYLEEDKEKRIQKDINKKENILIEGDNLESLMALQYTHKGLIDLVYIDPPYNTGNKDFTYNDKYIDKENTWRHSLWLSFMNKRLKLAKELLSDTGVIFLSIDENEFSQLKLLCDDIFGENNFIETIIRKTGVSARLDAKFLSREHEYLLIYAKNKSNIEFSKNYLDVENDNTYIHSDEFVNERGRYKLNKLDRGSIKFSEKARFEIEAPDGTQILPGNGKDGWSWRWSKEKVKWGIENKFIVIKKVKGSWSVYFKQYQYVDNSNKRIERKIPYKNLLLDGFNNEKGSSLLKSMGITNFSYPKPIELIKFILKLSPNKDITVLDFFAGSGTTGHAVLEMNKEDGGNRNFILCTNNENNICEEVTYKRLSKVINGYENLKGKNIIGIPSNLRYYKTKKIEKTNNNELDQFNLLNKTFELVQIKENAFNIVQENGHFSIISNTEKTVGLYSFGIIDYSKIEEMLNTLMNDDKKEKVAYIPVENISEVYDFVDDKYIGVVRFEKLPKELIDIYNKLNRN